MLLSDFMKIHSMVDVQLKRQSVASHDRNGHNLLLMGIREKVHFYVETGR